MPENKPHRLIQQALDILEAHVPPSKEVTKALHDLRDYYANLEAAYSRAVAENHRLVEQQQKK